MTTSATPALIAPTNTFNHMYQLTSVKLPNVKSLARDNLANERTYLAWLKTSLVFVSAGIALAQLNRFAEQTTEIAFNGYVVTLASPTGGKTLSSRWAAICVVWGIVVLLMGTFRFYHAQHMIVDGAFPVARYSVAFTSAAAMVAAALYVVSSANV